MRMHTSTLDFVRKFLAKRIFASKGNLQSYLEGFVLRWLVLKIKVFEVFRQLIIKCFQVHASETENLLANKFIDDEMTFQNALKVLDQELCPEENLLNPDSDYLKTVAQGLFYKV